jgi:nitric oxide reductase activation protein
MKVQIKTARKFGLEVFQVWISGVYATEFMSEAGAKTYVANLFRKGN